MAVLLGAVLAPTDPVLASDVQVSGPADREDLRIALTGEAGLNDGTAFPFVMLGLGLMGIHELGPFGVRWLALDVVWAVAGGLAIGALSGTLVARIVLYLRRTHREAVGLDEFLGLGLIALSYGLALSLHTYGFLAVFAAGLAVRQVERRETGEEPKDPQVIEEATGGDPETDATHPDRAPAYLASVLLGFNEQLERIGEIALVVLVGAMLSTIPISLESVIFAALLFLVLRPIAVLVGLAGSRTPAMQRAYIAWFGIRGIGSLYYLMFALAHGLPDGLGATLAEIVLVTVGMSIVVHGVSVTPLMERYEAYRRRRALAA
jgi:NhaP-type Na+/H+ or K+/H+ antiporter